MAPLDVFDLRRDRRVAKITNAETTHLTKLNAIL
jgi:hypothetical protein